MRITIILLLLVTQGCLSKKSKPTVIEYTLVEEKTSVPLSNIKVLLTKKAFPIFGSPYHIIDTLTTNKHGKISYMFQHESGYSNYTSPIFNNDFYASFKDEILTKGKTNSNTLKLSSWSSLSLNLKNKSKKYKSIAIYFNTVNHDGRGDYQGKFIDTILTFNKSLPSEPCTIYYTLFENELYSSNAVKSDTFFTTNNSLTTTMTLEK